LAVIVGTKNVSRGSTRPAVRVEQRTPASELNQ
jgi:hypothetical protein